MTFSSSVFIFVFLPIALILYYLPVKPKEIYRNIALLLVSMVFYTYGEPVYAVLLLCSILVNYALGFTVAKDRPFAKLFLILAVIGNLGLVFSFKYLDFFISNMGYLLHRDFPLRQLALPVGISFYTFQELSYLFDVYNGKSRTQKSLVRFALYACLFPVVLSGPIVKYHNIEDELQDRHTSFRELPDHASRFALGLAKKVLLANNLAVVASHAFSLGQRSVLMAWTGALAFTLQAYFDFSGYSDMAIAVGALFGFHLPENFRYPFAAESITDFWRRWHMSLTGWFREYLYFPLGGNRVRPARHIFNMLVVWMFTGLWHGANWTFIIWGLWFFVFLVLEKYTGFQEKLGAFGHVYTWLVVLISFVFFNASGVSAGLSYLASMVGIGSTGLWDGQALHFILDYKWFIGLGLLFSFPVYPELEKRFCSRRAGCLVWQLLLCVLFVFSVSFVLSGEYDPFLYFNF